MESSKGEQVAPIIVLVVACTMGEACLVLLVVALVLLVALVALMAHLVDGVALLECTVVLCQIYNLHESL